MILFLRSRSLLSSAGKSSSTAFLRRPRSAPAFHRLPRLSPSPSQQRQKHYVYTRLFSTQGGGGGTGSSGGSSSSGTSTSEHEHGTPAASTMDASQQQQQHPQLQHANNKLYEVSVCAVQGGRSYMEDEYFVNQAGTFGAVFDGHGGPAVSRYLRQNLYANLVSFSSMTEERALSAALHKVDLEVQRISHWSYQGSTAIAAWIVPQQQQQQPPPHHRGAGGDNGDNRDNNNHTTTTTTTTTPSTTLIVANIGDSRAVMSYQRQNQTENSNNNNSTIPTSSSWSCLDLSVDHKPHSPEERARIEARGGRVVWSGLVDRGGRPVPDHGVYRVNGNLALSRAIGDRAERPAVSAEPDVRTVRLEEYGKVHFVVLATDGLWDVMTSQEVVSFCHHKLMQATATTKTKGGGGAATDAPPFADNGESAATATSSSTTSIKRETIQRKMAEFLVAEALRRGTVDNVTVVILWLS